jgi:hypothetical protein
MRKLRPLTLLTAIFALGCSVPAPSSNASSSTTAVSQQPNVQAKGQVAGAKWDNISISYGRRLESAGTANEYYAPAGREPIAFDADMTFIMFEDGVSDKDVNHFLSDYHASIVNRQIIPGLPAKSIPEKITNNYYIKFDTTKIAIDDFPRLVSQFGLAGAYTFSTEHGSKTMMQVCRAESEKKLYKLQHIGIGFKTELCSFREGFDATTNSILYDPPQNGLLGSRLVQCRWRLPDG